MEREDYRYFEGKDLDDNEVVYALLKTQPAPKCETLREFIELCLKPK